MYAERNRVTLHEDPVQERRLWANVREVAEAVVASADAPAGFVRRELPVGERQLDAYASLTDGDGGMTVVVVVAAPTDSRAPTAAQIRSKFGLTPREAEVALLLAARRSNKEIAQKLSIAHKTAWRHTESVLSKLNTGSRRDVGRVLRAAMGEETVVRFPAGSWPASVS